MEEVWKDIPNYEGIYEASTFGRIRTKEGKVTFSVRHGKRIWKSRILKYRGNNYQTGNRVCLYKDKEIKEWLVGRLIAITFLGIPESKMTVNHIDNNRLNNRVENLEWLTLGENIRAGFITGAFPQHKVKLICEDGSEHIFRSKVQASKFLGRNECYVCTYLNRKRKKLSVSKDGKKYQIIQLEGEKHESKSTSREVSSTHSASQFRHKSD